VDSDTDSDSDDKEYKEYKEDGSVSQVTKVDPKTRTTIRNLRIREDTAKYLRNLDLNSAYYDPKTRSMRENPNPSDNPEEVVYAGDNHIRSTGDSKKFMNMQSYAWEAYEKGLDLHIQGAPSEAEFLFEHFKVSKEAMKQKAKDHTLSRYGGEEHLDSLPKALLFSQTENFTIYSRDGKPLKAPTDRLFPRSKYEEDVHLNNHTSVWGSYWENGNWGYSCCWQLVKNSYCTGKAGRDARIESLILQSSLAPAEIPLPYRNDLERDTNKEKERHREKDKEKDKDGEKTKEEKAQRSSDRHTFVELDERKRPYNSMSKNSWEVTDEEMQTYTAKKIHFEDPMRKFLST
jgi:pre-mRNA-processing factor SLU7